VDGTALNDVWIHINAQDWQDLHATYQTNNYYPVDFEWNGVKVSNAGIRVKGNSTRNPQKPSFRVDFNRYVDSQNFLGETALVLNSSWADPSNIHDRVSMALFRLMGVPAPRQASVKLFVGANREYAGVYAVSEEVDKQFLDEHFGRHDGYLYSYNGQPGDPWQFDDRGTGLDWYIPRFTPKTHDTESNFNLYQPIKDFVQTVDNAPQADLENALAPYFDVNMYITEIAIQNFVDQTDGLLGGAGMNNFYLYRFPDTQFWQVIPWDQDQSFWGLDEAPQQNMNLNILANKIWNEPAYRDRYLSKIVDIGNTVGTPAGDNPSPGWLEQEILYEAAQVRDAVYADPLKPYSSDDFESAVALMLEFARQRDAYERGYIAQFAPEVLAANGKFRIQSLRVRTSK
jgi:spore coat protein CotH